MSTTGWDVILRDDDITMPDVIAYALIRVLGLTPADAVAVSLRGHRHGSALVAGFDEAQRADDVLTGLRYYGLNCEVVARG